MRRDILCAAIIVVVILLIVCSTRTESFEPHVSGYVSNDMMMGRKYGRFNLPVIRKLAVRNHKVANAIKHMQ